MNDERCQFCLNRWGCHGIYSRCEIDQCGHNHNGHCLDVVALKQADKQTGVSTHWGVNVGLKRNEIYLGDCLIESDKIESGSVDLILTDLPYGTMNGFNGIDWDFAIDPKKVYEIANRVLRRMAKWFYSAKSHIQDNSQHKPFQTYPF